jgi:protein-disulfide isomerase
MTADGRLILGRLIDLDQKKDLTSIAEVRYQAAMAVLHVENSVVELNESFNAADAAAKVALTTVISPMPIEVESAASVGNKPKSLREGYAQLMVKLPESQMIVYDAVGETKTTLTVITDYTCPYCKQFHKETLPLLREAGVKVRYMLSASGR